jgi:hypothetical protein
VSLVELHRYFTTIEAEVDRTMLGSHGIEAIVFDSGLNSTEGGGFATAVRLMVLDEDYAAALRMITANAPPGQG